MQSTLFDFRICAECNVGMAEYSEEWDSIYCIFCKEAYLHVKDIDRWFGKGKYATD